MSGISAAELPDIDRSMRCDETHTFDSVISPANRGECSAQGIGLRRGGEMYVL